MVHNNKSKTLFISAYTKQMNLIVVKINSWMHCVYKYIYSSNRVCQKFWN